MTDYISTNDMYGKIGERIRNGRGRGVRVHYIAIVTDDKGEIVAHNHVAERFGMFRDDALARALGAIGSEGFMARAKKLICGDCKDDTLD